MDGVDMELRDQLDRIFNPGLNDEELSTKLKLLKDKFNHDISISQTRSNFENKFSHNFTCFEFALGLNESSEYTRIKKNLANSYMRGIFCNACFIKWLLDKNDYLNSNPTNDMKIIVIYKKMALIKHAGIIKDSSDNNSYVISKFGIGHVYEHPINQVPESYGFPSICYERPSLPL